MAFLAISFFPISRGYPCYQFDLPKFILENRPAWNSIQVFLNKFSSKALVPLEVTTDNEDTNLQKVGRNFEYKKALTYPEAISSCYWDYATLFSIHTKNDLEILDYFNLNETWVFSDYDSKAKRARIPSLLIFGSRIKDEEILPELKAKHCFIRKRNDQDPTKTFIDTRACTIATDTVCQKIIDYKVLSLKTWGTLHDDLKQKIKTMINFKVDTWLQQLSELFENYGKIDSVDTNDLPSFTEKLNLDLLIPSLSLYEGLGDSKKIFELSSLQIIKDLRLITELVTEAKTALMEHFSPTFSFSADYKAICIRPYLVLQGMDENNSSYPVMIPEAVENLVEIMSESEENEIVNDNSNSEEEDNEHSQPTEADSEYVPGKYELVQNRDLNMAGQSDFINPYQNTYPLVPSTSFTQRNPKAPVVIHNLISDGGNRHLEFSRGVGLGIILKNQITELATPLLDKFKKQIEAEKSKYSLNQISTLRDFIKSTVEPMFNDTILKAFESELFHDRVKMANTELKLGMDSKLVTFLNEIFLSENPKTLVAKFKQTKFYEDLPDTLQKALVSALGAFEKLSTYENLTILLSVIAIFIASLNTFLIYCFRIKRVTQNEPPRVEEGELPVRIIELKGAKSGKGISWLQCEWFKCCRNKPNSRPQSKLRRSSSTTPQGKFVSFSDSQLVADTEDYLTRRYRTTSPSISEVNRFI